MKRPERHTQAVIVDMLPSLPKPFSRRTLLDHWPSDLRQPSDSALDNALRALYRQRLIGIASGCRGRVTWYDALPVPAPPLRPQEKAWRLFKQQNNIGL